MILRVFKLLLIALAVLLALFALLVAVAWRQPGAVFVVVIPLSIVLVLGSLLWMLIETASRRRRGAALLGYIEQAVRLNLPLPRLVRAMAESECGRLAQDLDRARERLERGESLVSLLEVIPQVPPRVIGLVAAAERSGRLSQVLSKLLEQRRRAIARGLGFMPFYRTYPLIMGLAFIGVTSILMIFVMPKFQQLFKDFGMQLPGITVGMLSFYRVAWPWLPLLAAILFIALLVNTITSRWVGSGFGMTETMLARIASYLPWIGHVRMQRALGDVLDCTADAIEAGRPIETALTEAGHVCGNSRVRRRVDGWVQLLLRGRSLSDGARDAGMPSLVSGMLATALQTPDLTPVLRFLARYYSTRFSRSIALLEASVAPVIAISMGILVGWLALSVFAPLISLIQCLSSPAPRSL